MPESLDLVVTSVATQLMGATSATAKDVCQNVLADLVAYFGVDVSFLRRNDHTIRASVLVAEWPVRPGIPDPDPLAVVYFTDADPVFAMAEHQKEPVVFRPEPATDDYQRTINEGRQVAATSMACVPLLSGEVTSGVLGFVKFGDRNWTDAELNALKAIASLLAQVQARVDAEEQLRYLADHDDLTGCTTGALCSTIWTYVSPTANPDRCRHCSSISTGSRRSTTIWATPPVTGSSGVLPSACAEARTGPTVIARLGGDEFVVVPATPMDAEAAEALAVRLQAALRERVAIDGEMLTRTVSIGVALGMPGHDSTSDLLRRADQAVLTAKNSGGKPGCGVHRRHVAGERVPQRHRAPFADGGRKRCAAAALSARGGHAHRRHRRHGSVGALAASHARPADPRFLHRGGRVDQHGGRAGPVGAPHGVRRVRRWRSRGHGRESVVRINVSPVQLVTEGFVESVKGAMADNGLPPGSVCLEITETVVVQDIETTRITLDGLKEAGVLVAIDDFGTGYSALSQLKSLPVDTLKIDRSFVRELGSDPGDLAIVRAIIALAEAFGLELVAEGVETRAAALTLLRHGCHRAQGFLLSRPIAAGPMESLLAKGRIDVDF